MTPEEQLAFIKTYRSDLSTSLVSLIVPPMTLQPLKDMVKSELSTAGNIKNRQNRQSVMAALTKVHSVVSDMKTIPDTGMAIYAGQYI
jgi:peptide subunit release factor 1 (eRF1)